MIENLKTYIPKKAKIVEPFVGGRDLILEGHDYVEWYDIDSSYAYDDHLRDTLLDPPEYEGKYVITNPPYLAKNKAEDKEIFEKYNVDDLYKAAIKSIKNCEGGLLIIPFNFFTDENSKKERIEFFRRFHIEYMNVFNLPAFESTTCAFVFSKKEKKSKKNQIIKTLIFDENKEVELLYEDKYGYKLGGKEINDILNEEVRFTRLIKNKKSNTNIKIYCLDTRYEPIRAEIDEPFYAKTSDRVYLTLKALDKEIINEKNEKEFCKLFNQKINEIRNKYYNLIFTTYRDFGRKRLSFNFAYKLATLVAKELKKGK